MKHHRNAAADTTNKKLIQNHQNITRTDKQVSPV